MIEVTQAAHKASKYLKSFYPQTNNILSEEVERDTMGGQWLITLSFPTSESELLSPFQQPSPKNKLFRKDAENGNMIARKIRHNALFFAVSNPIVL
jgi:hypothetical protein